MRQVTMPSLERPVTTTFVSQRLVYRSVEVTDKEAFYTIISEPGCMELGLPKISRPPSRKQMDEFVNTYPEKALIFVFICLRENSSSGIPSAGKPIGSLNMGHSSLEAKKGHRATSFGIFISEAYRSKGYGMEATEWAIDWAFNYAGVHRIELWSFSYNEAAIRLWEKIGLRQEGRKRESVWFQRKWFDTVMYSILEQEWEAMRDRLLQ